MSEFPVSNDGENTPLESNADKTFETELKTSLSTCRVSPRLLCGVTNQITFNKGALDWGYHGLLAFGSNCSVVTTDTNNIQPVQCLTKHRAIVNKVLWAPKIENCNLVTLVSSDTAGQIIHWNIGSGECIAVFQDGTKGILGMEWVPSADESCLLLATLHSPYHLVIWDVLKQTKLWKKGFTDTLISFSFNPFDGTRLAFLCPDCILFVDDFNPLKIPSTNGRKFYISSPRLTDGPEDVTRTRDRLKRLMKGLVVAETKPRPEDAMTVSECLQLVYHRSQRDHILLLYPRDILMVDLHINQTVGVISIEKAMSPLVQIISTRQRDVIYCLHESGSVSVKVRRKGAHAPYLPSPMDAPTESLASLDAAPNSSETFMGYDHKCQSEVIRQIKGSRVLGMTCDLLSERNIALLLSSGKLVFLELGKIGESIEFTLNQLFGPSTDELTVLPPLRLLVTGLMSSVASQPTVIKMCPPLTSKNRHFYKPLMAAGTNSGLIQIYNMAWGSVEKEFSLHSYPVRGIEWISLSSFISYAHSSTNSQVRNEMFITDVNTGYTNQIRKDHGEENPIEIVRVSPLKQYFVVVMKDGPFELWDLKTLTLMRSMPKKFPLVTALEWSPAHNFKLLKTKKKSVSEDPSKAENPAGDTSASSPQTTQQVVAREHFVFTDTESLLYHFTLEGIFVKDVIKMPPEAGMSQITS
ncbi:hypothetical protein LSTR_LSTR001947 [Laodelphax striatellus]|uniref:WD repeat-containing protein 11 n=1 Tax=Laodelphax striatellus TaxID=195883 RepID=A0A482XGH8_LAOST|nr:hypothetical protein LSTR_LSTR001947 [Laodelphax striatellus]